MTSVRFDSYDFTATTKSDGISSSTSGGLVGSTCDWSFAFASPEAGRFMVIWPSSLPGLNVMMKKKSNWNDMSSIGTMGSATSMPGSVFFWDIAELTFVRSSRAFASS